MCWMMAGASSRRLRLQRHLALPDEIETIRRFTFAENRFARLPGHEHGAVGQHAHMLRLETRQKRMPRDNALHSLNVRRSASG